MALHRPAQAAGQGAGHAPPGEAQDLERIVDGTARLVLNNGKVSTTGNPSTG
jgi:hypothetical protein